MERRIALTRELACYAVESRFDALPDVVQHEAARAFLNWVGVAVGGSQEPAVADAARYVEGAGGHPRAQVVGQALRTDPARAAFVNCIASSVLAFDDAHLPTVAHPSGPAAAAVFALAQARGASGREFLNALALGIEVQCRIARLLVLPPSPMNPSFYVNGFSGPIGVAAAAGRLLGLGLEQVLWALGIAASQACGFRATHGTMAAHFRPGHACATGLTSAFLAEQGFDCTEDALEAVGGFVDVFAPGSDLSIALEGLGATYEMLENRYKPYPCGILVHPTIDACEAVAARLSGKVVFASVRLFVNPLAVRLTGKRDPLTALESHVSVYHWAAVALLGGPLGIEATRGEYLTNPGVRALSSLIEAVPDESIGRGEARVEVELADGRSIEEHVTAAKGSKTRPMTDAELDSKFMGLTKDLMPVRAADRLRVACWRVAESDDVGAEIGSLLP